MSIFTCELGLATILRCLNVCTIFWYLNLQVLWYDTVHLIMTYSTPLQYNYVKITFNWNKEYKFGKTPCRILCWVGNSSMQKMYVTYFFLLFFPNTVLGLCRNFSLALGLYWFISIKAHRITSVFCEKWKFLTKTENFYQRSKLVWKIEIVVKNGKFWQKSKLLSKIKIVVKNPNFSQKSKL